MISPNDQALIDKWVADGATEEEAYQVLLDWHDEMRHEEENV